jgi:hypothetical protein
MQDYRNLRMWHKLHKIHGPLTEQVEDVRRMLSGLVQSLMPAEDRR